MTGLPLAQAALANNREYSEAVRWLGDAARKQQFIDWVTSQGANVLQGGRFLGVAGRHDKGAALAWLRQCYQDQKPGVEICDLACGDGPNDAAMLDAAGDALLIRSPAHRFPTLRRPEQDTYFSRLYGPAGWAEGVEHWLAS